MVKVAGGVEQWPSMSQHSLCILTLQLADSSHDNVMDIWILNKDGNQEEVTKNDYFLINSFLQSLSYEVRGSTDQ